MTDSNTKSDAWGEPTRWSLIERAAGQRPDEDVQHAWRQLLDRYRPAVEQSVRRVLRDHPQWQEAASDFFAYLYEQELLPRVDRDQGRFRCYMQGVLRRFALHWRRTSGRTSELDVDDVEIGGAEEDAEFERAEESAWALTILRNAMKRFQASHPRDAEFVFRAYGIAPWTASTREELCADFGVNPNQLNVAIHRGRARLAAEIDAEIRELVRGREDFETEHALFLERLSAAHPGLISPEAAAGA